MPQSRQNKIFDKVTGRNPKMSAFDLSREQKLSCRMGDLVPTYLDEIVPGDTFNVRTEIMMRLAPMISPVMHRVNVYMHYFFIPHRLVWNEWEDFITGGKDGDSDPVYPTFTLNQVEGLDDGRLPDYLGLPNIPNQGPGGQTEISALPFRAYQLLYNEYYRDENLNAEIDITSPLPDQAMAMRQRAWEKDYFTSSLPFAQRGPEVGIPIDLDYKDTTEVYTNTGGQPTPGDLRVVDAPSPDEHGYVNTPEDAQGLQFQNLETEELDVSINDLRRSSALQRWLEKSARGGYRYVETILSHFGVRSKDSRLQRPEYLGGGQQPITISEVLNTTGTEEAPQGTMAGHGISTGRTNSFNRKFTEHGYVMGIMSVLPRTAYQQGIHRHWNRFDRFDYYWPEFANLGEQEVKNKELYADVDDPDYNEGTFGYQQRYAEMKYGNSTVHGDFRTTLDYWHMGRIFANQPSLNAEFIQADPTNRIFAVTTGDHLWVQMYHNVKARRPMPFFADPRLT